MSDKKPDASFVIPAYNAEAYLAETIVSCLTQSHKNIEVVVVDDGSDKNRDATALVAKHFVDRDPRVRYFRIANQGRGFARNVGCGAALADLLLMLDADDRAEKGRVKATLELYKQNPDAYLSGGAAIINAFGAELGHVIPDPFNLAKALETKHNNIVHSTAAFPKTLWQRYQFDNQEYAELGLDDWHQQIRMGLDGVKFACTPKLLAGYTQLATGISKTRDPNKVAELKEKFLKEAGAYASAA